MTRSMTGFGRAQQTVDGRDITVEIKSVNHRYFEFSARVPRAYGYLEDKLKSYLQSSISRGKVEVGVTMVTVEGTGADVEINQALAQGYIDALRQLGQATGLKDDLTLTSISRFSDIFAVHKTSEDEDVVWEAVRQVVDQAVAKFVAMRQTEGARLKADVEGRLDTIEAYVGQVEQLAPQTVENYRKRLYDKIAEVLADSRVDEQRILTEAAIFAERIAVDEETVRLRSHLAQFRGILQQSEPVGRKLDFLVQEINRETNTIGSKAQDLQVAKIVVEIKAEIEKIREQIQNLE